MASAQNATAPVTRTAGNRTAAKERLPASWAQLKSKPVVLNARQQQLAADVKAGKDPK